jgi:hypothetical protein
MKKSDNDSNAPSDKKTYKRKYILRVYEEQEAQQEIKHYEDKEKEKLFPAREQP